MYGSARLEKNHELCKSQREYQFKAKTVSSKMRSASGSVVLTFFSQDRYRVRPHAHRIETPQRRNWINGRERSYGLVCVPEKKKEEEKLVEISEFHSFIGTNPPAELKTVCGKK